jgi:hypothetical protein
MWITLIFADKLVKDNNLAGKGVKNNFMLEKCENNVRSGKC